MDTVHVEFVLCGGHIDLIDEYDVFTWIGDHREVSEQLAARRMGWA